MTTTNEFGYDHVFELARQLSPEEQDRLIRALAEQEPVRKPEWKPPETLDESGGEFEIVTVDTGNPIFTEEDFAQFEKNRQALLASIDWEQAEKNRQELMRSMLNLPECTEEDIKLQDEIRESMERWKT